MSDKQHSIWIRPPTKGRCPHTGLTRGTYYNLIARGVIKSSNVKQPGKLTGIRLIWLPSVLEYIERHVEKVTP
jgi:hypothetical protein